MNGARFSSGDPEASFSTAICLEGGQWDIDQVPDCATREYNWEGENIKSETSKLL